MPKSQQGKFYKNRYLIYVYDTDEQCIGTYDNHKQFEEAYHHLNEKQNGKGKNYQSATSTILSRLSLGKRKSFFSLGQRLFIDFIDMSEEVES